MRKRIKKLTRRFGVVLLLLVIIGSIIIPIPFAGDKVIAQGTVEETSWGYLYQLDNGDYVEVGDSSTTDFKASVKTIRGDCSFTLGWTGGTFVPTLDGLVTSFDFDSNINVSIYPVEPSARLPLGGIEYDITLASRPARNVITLDIDWEGMTWQKILALDVEYDQASCEEEWGIEHYPFVITPTSIISVTSDVLKTREEYEVNSYLGTAVNNNHNVSDVGGGITYSTVSRTHLYIHRGQITDNLGDTAWVEGIELDEGKKEITFTLPKTWLRNASYPISQVCGVDPAYTEDMDNWVSDTYSDSDNTWSDYDIFTEKGVPKGAVAEIIVTNLKSGTEENMGVRTDGSSLDRYVQLHEAEGGGVTTCRLFAVCHITTGLIETYCADVSDDQVFYLLGYWENVGFMERFDDETPVTLGSWSEEALVDSGAASRVCHMLLRNQNQDTSVLMGTRNNLSPKARYIVVNEPESNGECIMDMMVKADASYKVKLYVGLETVITNAGYFGSELDFVELFEAVADAGDSTWNSHDISEYLDQDGRITDWLLTHEFEDDPETLGARDGDDTTTNRYILVEENETSSSVSSTGFGITAKSNASGEVYLYSSTADEEFYLMGYFKPTAGGEADISNTPDSKAWGIVNADTSSNTAINLFTVTNNGDTCTITIQGTDFTGGDDTWDLSDTATPGENIYGLKAGLDDDDDNFDIIVKEAATYNTLVAGLANLATQDWGLKLYMPTSITNYDGQLMVATVTLVATLD